MFVSGGDEATVLSHCDMKNSLLYSTLPFTVILSIATVAAVLSSTYLLCLRDSVNPCASSFPPMLP